MLKNSTQIWSLSLKRREGGMKRMTRRMTLLLQVNTRCLLVETLYQNRKKKEMNTTKASDNSEVWAIASPNLSLGHPTSPPPISHPACPGTFSCIFLSSTTASTSPTSLTTPADERKGCGVRMRPPSLMKHHQHEIELLWRKWIIKDGNSVIGVIRMIQVVSYGKCIHSFKIIYLKMIL